MDFDGIFKIDGFVVESFCVQETNMFGTQQPTGPVASPTASPVPQVPGSTLLAKLPGSGWDSSYSGPRRSGLVSESRIFMGNGWEKGRQGAMESLG